VFDDEEDNAFRATINPDTGCLPGPGEVQNYYLAKYGRETGRVGGPCPCDEPGCLAGMRMCRTNEGELQLTSKMLASAFASWCDEFAWSAGALATMIVEAFMLGEEAPDRATLEAEHRAA